MPKKDVTYRTASQVWDEIDSTVVNVLGARVFYNHPICGKSLAFVSRAFKPDDALYRNSNGQIQNGLFVVRSDGGGCEEVLAPYSSDRAVGTFALANDGDLRN